MQPGEPLPSLLTFIRRPAWMARAACRGTDVNTFFPAQGDRPDSAREVCGGCPVQVKCHDYAMADPDLDGCWGGMTARERAALRRRVS
jgi:WhiB family redox-sensing transcriptional regulator